MESLRDTLNFELPYPGAWAVRIVQAGVAAGLQQDIEVFIDPDKIRFVFMPPEDWTAHTLEQALSDPGLTGNLSLDYLVTALRFVSLKENSGFRLYFGNGSILEWKDAKFQIREGQRTDWGRIKLAVFQSGAACEDGPNSKACVRRNAEVHKALCSRCFVCPNPLRLDGRKIDDLFSGVREISRDMRAGSGAPIAAGIVEADMPSWPIPSQTFVSKLNHNESDIDNFEYRGNAPQETADLAFHLEAIGNTGVGNKSRLLKSTPTLFWIDHGAIVHHEKLDLPEFSLSLSIFCSAEGLDPNPLDFVLPESADREKRKLTAVKSLSKPLSEIDTDLGQAIHPTKKLGKFTGPKIIAGGVLLAPFVVVMPALAKPLILASSLLGSGVTIFETLKGGKKSGDTLKNALEELQDQWPTE